MRSVVYPFLLLAIVAGTSLCYGQNYSMSPNWNACEFLSKAEAESILGTAVKLRAQNPYQCWYVNVGFTNKPPSNKQVNLDATKSNRPDPNSYVELKKAWTTPPYGDPGAVITDIPNFEDAALWTWAGTGGTLGAFKDGTMSVTITVTGIQEAPALRAAKALAAKVLGGTAETGYIYLGIPKSNVAAEQAARAAHRVRKTARVAVPARQSASNGVYGAYCEAGISGRTDYFSDAFGTPENDPKTIFKAFKPYLAHKYSKPLWAIGGSCRTFSTVEKARAARQEQMAMYRQGERTNPPGPRVEETDWKYAAPPGARTANKVTVSATLPNGEKSACHLISTSALESIVGLHFFATRSRPADTKVVSLIAPRIIASSSCQYSADNGGVTLSVWYTESFNPKIAKYDLLNYEEHNHAGGDDVTSRDFPYPAAFAAIGAGTYVFKNGPKGLIVLEVESGVSVTDDERTHVARDKKIALKILGSPGPQQRLPAHAAAGAIVHEPPAYWYAYRTDIIGQVVEGEFRNGWNSSSQFQEAFTTYVDQFSAHCRADLPARHVAMSVTQTANSTDRNGNVVGQQQLQSYTVDMDPRFAQKYKEYYQSLTSSLDSLGNALAVASGRLSMDDVFAAGNDMIKFFSIETCQSPVMHLLGENLLRAANGNLPVQGRIRRAPSAPRLQSKPSKPTEVFDASMPNYTITSKMAGNEISRYCRGLYNPTFAVLTPQQWKFAYKHSDETQTDADDCASKFDPHEVATHRRIAMHYCLGKYDYFLVREGQTSNLIYDYRKCMSQNDTLTALCTMELRYRSELEHETNWAGAKCTAPQPNNLEAVWIRHNYPKDIRALGGIPPSGPGLPPILLAPMKPGVLQRAREAPAIPRLSFASSAPARSAATPKQVAAPAAVPHKPAAARRATAAQTQESRQQRAAEQRKLGRELFACEQQALKDHPEHGAAFAKAIQACGQQMRAKERR